MQFLWSALMSTLGTVPAGSGRWAHYLWRSFFLNSSQIYLDWARNIQTLVINESNHYTHSEKLSFVLKTEIDNLGNRLWAVHVYIQCWYISGSLHAQARFGCGFPQMGRYGGYIGPSPAPKKALLSHLDVGLWLEPWSRRRPLLFTTQSGLGVRRQPINKRVCSQPTLSHRPAIANCALDLVLQDFANNTLSN